MLGYLSPNIEKVVSLSIRNAEDIKKTNLLPLSGFSYKGVNQEYFILPEVKQLEQYSRKEITIPEKKIPMKDWLEFFGFWLADGCYRDHINTYGKRDYTISIKQNKKNESYVLDLINRIGFKAEITTRFDDNKNYNIYSKQLWEYLYQFGRSADKYIPREFLDLDIDYLKALWTGYTNGDGSLCKNGQWHFSSVSKNLIDSIQELILKIFGIITQVHKRTRKHSYDDNYGTCYEMSVKLDRWHKDYSKYGTPDKVQYDDNVYCLTLEKNHIMLVRHNGKIGWCGNCFREYVATLMEHNKKFLIIGNKNAITYKEFFPLLKDNKVWIGYNNVKEFIQPDGSIKKFGNIGWFTNLDIAKRYEKLILWKNFTSEEYPRYDNYLAWNVDKVAEIPCDDYIDVEFGEGELCQYMEMYPDLEILENNKIRIHNPIYGVPITFLDKYNPEQFEIVGQGQGNLYRLLTPKGLSQQFVDDYYKSGQKGSIKEDHPVLGYYDLNGKPVIPYMRILIHKKTGAKHD